MIHTYNAYLRYCGTVETPEDVGHGLDATKDELPHKPWPTGTWPYYLDGGWELVQTHPE